MRQVGEVENQGEIQDMAILLQKNMLLIEEIQSSTRLLLSTKESPWKAYKKFDLILGEPCEKQS